MSRAAASVVSCLPWLLVACATMPPPLWTLEAVATDLPPFIARQLHEHDVPGLCIAVLDAGLEGRDAHCWARGFGVLRPEGPPMPADAVLRVASISKLFTDTAAMVLVERGVLDLDAPVTRWLPEFAPDNPFGGAITLRHLMSHRAGLVREGPVGHYFDPSAPSLQATVASLGSTRLVHAPGSAFKYSNHGVAVVGAVIERVTGKDFATAVRELVLHPLGLVDSEFAERPVHHDRRAEGVMWTYDGRAIATPTFRFGYPPAVELRTTTLDLVAFARSWLPGARTRVLSPAAQAAMWELPPGVDRACGLGFFVRSFQGQREVGHDGAVYGTASALRALPEQGLAVAVVVTKDFANPIAEGIAERALSIALAARAGRRLPAVVHPRPVGREAARALAGRYRVGSNHVDLYEQDGELFYDPNLGVRTRLRRRDDGALVSDDALSIGDRVLTQGVDGRLHDGQEYYVREAGMPELPPRELLPLLGEYGHDHDVLVVYEDEGRLAVLIEWVVRDQPDRVGPDQYVFPPGMYGGDPLRFERDAGGRVVAAVVGGARFLRRPEANGGFRIEPQRPIAELLAAAAEAKPPVVASERASDLVELATLDPTLRFDLRYATDDNFVGAPVYPATAKAWLQRPAARALVAVQRRLASRGLGLWVFDAYRPWSVTKVFWEATPPALREFVADPAQGSRHNRGCAVDVTLYELATGQPVEMPSAFDEFTPRAYPRYPGGTARQRWHRDVLRAAMAAEGFTVNPSEWWHFDHEDWQRYPIGNTPL